MIHALKLEREWGNDFEVARLLNRLSAANEGLGLYEEGIKQVKEALVIFERLGEVVKQADCWNGKVGLTRLKKRDYAR